MGLYFGLRAGSVARCSNVASKIAPMLARPIKLRSSSPSPSVTVFVTVVSPSAKIAALSLDFELLQPLGERSHLGALFVGQFIDAEQSV